MIRIQKSGKKLKIQYLHNKTKKTILIGSILNNDPFLQNFSNGNDIIVNNKVDESLQNLNIAWPNAKEAQIA